jgi:hypothetical protein
MAKITSSNTSRNGSGSKVIRPGIHSKTKTSNNKKSKNYFKKYRGQGR